MSDGWGAPTGEPVVAARPRRRRLLLVLALLLALALGAALAARSSTPHLPARSGDALATGGDATAASLRPAEPLRALGVSLTCSLPPEWRLLHPGLYAPGGDAQGESLTLSILPAGAPLPPGARVIANSAGRVRFTLPLLAGHLRDGVLVEAQGHTGIAILSHLPGSALEDAGALDPVLGSVTFSRA